MTLTSIKLYDNHVTAFFSGGGYLPEGEYSFTLVNINKATLKMDLINPFSSAFAPTVWAIERWDEASSSWQEVAKLESSGTETPTGAPSKSTEVDVTQILKAQPHLRYRGKCTYGFLIYASCMTVKAYLVVDYTQLEYQGTGVGGEYTFGEQFGGLGEMMSFMMTFMMMFMLMSMMMSMMSTMTQSFSS
jgi:hypothetical protein